MKDQLKKTFSSSSQHIPIKEEGFIKTENALLAARFDNLQLIDSYQNDAWNTTEYYSFWEQQPDDRENNDDFQSFNTEQDTYNRNRYCPISNQANP